MTLLRTRMAGGGGQFLRFCVVGGVGFAIDASVLLLLLEAGWSGPFTGRFLSFAAAVLATFELNRRWAFGVGVRTGYLQMLSAYVAVQGLGFAVNLGVYSLLLLYLPAALRVPLYCLAVASAVALVVNFSGAKFAVFRARPT